MATVTTMLALFDAFLMPRRHISFIEYHEQISIFASAAVRVRSRSFSQPAEPSIPRRHFCRAELEDIDHRQRYEFSPCHFRALYLSPPHCSSPGSALVGDTPSLACPRCSRAEMHHPRIGSSGDVGRKCPSKSKFDTVIKNGRQPSTPIML